MFDTRFLNVLHCVANDSVVKPIRYLLDQIIHRARSELKASLFKGNTVFPALHIVKLLQGRDRCGFSALPARGGELKYGIHLTSTYERS